MSRVKATWCYELLNKEADRNFQHLPIGSLVVFRLLLRITSAA